MKHFQKLPTKLDKHRKKKLILNKTIHLFIKLTDKTTTILECEEHRQ